MKKLLITFVLFLAGYNSIMAADYYWIGGTGDWNNLANWASSSGGAGNAYSQVPQTTDNVIFDANSFTANGQTVNINGTSTFCRNFDASAITRTGIIFNNTGTLNIYGNLLLNINIAYINTGFYPINFLAPGVAQIDTKGVDFRGFGIRFMMPATGSYTFLSDFSCSTFGFDLSIASGTVNFSDKNFTIQRLTGTGGTLNLNAAAINCTNLTMNSNIQVNGATSTIFATAVSFFETFTEMNATSAFNNLTLTGYDPSAANCVIRSNRLILQKGIGKTNNVAGNFVAPTIQLEAGYAYFLPETVTTDNLIINGLSCLKPTGLYGRASGTTINRSTGSWSGSVYTNLFLIGLRFTGGTVGNAIANGSVDGGGNTGITINSGANTLYWRGGTLPAGNDNWNDPNNWSTTADGATPATCIPDLNTDVIFNANSFTLPGRGVNLNTQESFCRNMTWTGTLNNPVLRAAPPVGIPQSRLLVKGSLEFATGMTTFMNGYPLGLNIIMVGQGNQTIKSNGVPFDGVLTISANGGNYKLLDALAVSRKFEINYGGLDTDGNPLNLNAFLVLGDPATTIPATVNLRNSIVTITYQNPPSTALLNYPFQFDHENATCNFGTSTININNSIQPHHILLANQSGGTLNFNKVVIGPNFTNNQSLVLAETGISFNELELNSSVKLDYEINTTAKINTKLKLVQGKTYTVQGGKTIDFGATGILEAIGNCSGFISIQSDNASPAIFRKSGGTITGDYLQLTDVTATGGATFNATNSIGIGNTTGWNITSGAPRTLYWVGNGGNWSDNNHWSLAPGGIGGNCPPYPSDNVIFDANSFTIAGQTVTFDQNPNCRNFDATAVSNTPTFTGSAAISFNLYGSLAFGTAMNWNFPGAFHLLGAGANRLATKDKILAETVYLNATGSYTLDEDFSGQLYFVVRKGTFDLNGKRLKVPSFVNSLVNFPGTSISTIQSGPIDIKLRNSQIEVNNWSFGTPATPAYPVNLDAGTSRIKVQDWFQTSAGSTYYDIEATSTTGSTGIASSSGLVYTIHDLIIQRDATIYADLTLSNDLSIQPGATLRFYSRRMTFTKTGDIQLVGTGAQPITLTSVSGDPYYFIKASGRICADFIYMRDNQASGGAIFTGGANANNQANNTGWDFNPYPLPGTTAYAGSTTKTVCYGDTGEVSVNFTTFAVQDFPKVLEYTITKGTSASSAFVTINRNNASPEGPYTFNIGAITDPASIQITKITSGGCFPKSADLTAAGLISNFTSIARPTAVLSNPSSQTNVCVGTAIPLSIDLTGTPPFNFQWTDGTATTNVSNYMSNNYIINATKTGTYRLASLADAQCTANTSSIGTVFSIVVNDPQLVITNPPVVVSPATVDLTVPTITSGSTPGLSLSYYTDANGSVPLSNPYVISESGTFYVKGMINGCETALTPINVTIALDYTPIIPNVFTPNGNGKNDFFVIGKLDLLLSSSLYIYNRWGSVVYQADNYKNDWDGANLNDGTYFYVLNCKSILGDKTYSGWLLLKR